jgi:hypothetical protein
MSKFSQSFEVAEVRGQCQRRVYEWGSAWVNPAPEDPTHLRFYAAVKVGDQPPVFVPEPTLAFQVSDELVYVDVDGRELAYVNVDGRMNNRPNGKISGIICQGGHRFSLSAAVFKSIKWAVNQDGSVTIDGEVWWPATLVNKDQNRYQQFGPAGEIWQNFDAYLVRVKRDVVRVLELGDLDLF